MLKLHAGISKKVGLPGFSSASASCTIEAELDSALLNDTEGFQLVVQRAYQSCEQAVQSQIARLLAQGNHAPASLDAAENVSEQPRTTNGPQTRSQSPSRASQPATQSAPEITEVRTSPAISGARVTTTGNTRIPAAQFSNQPSPRPATASQVKAIRAIASRRKIDLVGLLRDRFGLHTADELGIRQASDLIDELKRDGESGPGTNGHANGQNISHSNGHPGYATNGGAR